MKITARRHPLNFGRESQSQPGTEECLDCELFRSTGANGQNIGLVYVGTHHYPIYDIS